MYISRNRKPCFKCHGIGNVQGSLCPACRGYGSVSLMRLQTTLRQTNEGRSWISGDVAIANQRRAKAQG